MNRIHLFVFGRVQGVFFRATVQKWAKELKLTGWVKNLPDGSVEVVAEGPMDKLKKLMNLAKEGPPGANVDYIEVEWENKKENFKSFEIIHD